MVWILCRNLASRMPLSNEIGARAYGCYYTPCMQDLRNLIPWALNPWGPHGPQVG